MNYYVLDNSSDEAVIGQYPQTESMVPTYDYEQPNSVSKIPLYGIPEFEPDFHAVAIAQKAILTDLITAPINNSGILVNGKFRAVLEPFNLGISRFYEAPAVYRRKEFIYYWLQIGHVVEQHQAINYQKTRFIAKSPFPWHPEIFQLEAHTDSDLLALAKEYSWKPGLKITTDGPLFLESTALAGLDLFFFNFNGSIVVSERIRNAVIEHSITGIKFKEFDMVVSNNPL